MPRADQPVRMGVVGVGEVDADEGGQEGPGEQERAVVGFGAECVPRGLALQRSGACDVLGLDAVPTGGQSPASTDTSVRL